MIILGVETSCDDTGVALVRCEKDKPCQILSNIISSQVKTHAPFGGVVPNLAGREHLKNISPCLKAAFAAAHLAAKDIDLIAVTVGPGLIPSLLVGTSFAKALAYAWQKPILGVNHIEAHIYANWFSYRKFNLLHFPVLCLVVSGGHTSLILMKDHSKYQLLGETRDDAAGEAFDKVAKLLGLGYPGGPIISRLAKRYKHQATGIGFPRPMIDKDNFDFSFSGLKTAVLYFVKKLSQKQIKEMTPAVCAEFQQAAIDVLISKTLRAAKEYGVKTIMLSGGVAANQELREQMRRKISENIPDSLFLVPGSSLCTDNGAMIAAAAFYRLPKAENKSWTKIRANANLRLNG